MLDETSRAIGQLEASQAATQNGVAELKERIEHIDSKLDKLLARSNNAKLTLKHWATILVAGSFGGGGIAHAIHKIFE